MAPQPTLPRDVIDRPGAGTSSNEALFDLYMERAIDLLRLEAGTRDQVLAFLHDLEGELIALVARIDPTAGNKRIRLQNLLDEVTNAIRGSYRLADTFMGREIREIMDVESTWTGRAINASIHVDFADVGLTRNLLQTLVSNVLIQGASSSEWWSRQAGGMAERFADEIRRGMALGETNSDLVARIRGTQTTKGLMDLSRVSAERLVRASVQAAANTAREQVYADNTDLIKGLMWHATLDTRTSVWCITRDHHIYSPDKEHKPIDKGPAWLEGPGKIHWGCRSTSVPVLKSWRDLGIDEDDVPDTTRASMDGQVPHDLSFEAWLKRQSNARQDEVLGATKAQLWRDGKITFRDLLDQNGRPLTTEELRKKATE